MKHSLQVPVQTIDTAPAGGRELLKAAQGKFGFVPNLLGVLANAPALLEAYLSLSAIFDKTSFTPTERQIVLLATSFENGCEYCMAAHSAIATMQRVDAEVITALRSNMPIRDAKLHSLRALTVEVVRTRGWPSQAVVARFIEAGYAPSQALEVILGVGMKTLSNYANHLVGTPLDGAFEPVRWSSVANNPECGCAN